MGDWIGDDGTQFLAVKSYGDGPKYRCAIYKQNPITNEVTIRFSTDSTCSWSPNDYREILWLYPEHDPDNDNQLSLTLPEWTIGNWEDLKISENHIIFRDHSTFKTYKMKPIQKIDNFEKWLVTSETNCGETLKHCIALEQRSENLLEFQIGLKISKNNSNNLEICDSKYFSPERWLTQARLDSNAIKSPCPVLGEFTGIIPDAKEYCASLKSECQTPDFMNFKVMTCKYPDEIIESRRYRCIGQWEENGRIYTYAKRSDTIGDYECFDGIVGDNFIKIRESGENCKRNTTTEMMVIQKIADCEPITTPKYKLQTTTTSRGDHQSSEKTKKPHKKNYVTAESSCIFNNIKLLTFGSLLMILQLILV